MKEFDNIGRKNICKKADSLGKMNISSYAIRQSNFLRFIFIYF